MHVLLVPDAPCQSAYACKPFVHAVEFAYHGAFRHRHCERTSVHDVAVGAEDADGPAPPQATRPVNHRDTVRVIDLEPQKHLGTQNQ